MRKLTDWLDGYEEYVSRFEPPSIFGRWVGLLTLSIATGRQIWLEESNTKIYPNLYVVLVGPSGVGKGQSMRESIPFLDIAGVKRSPDKVTIPKLTRLLAENPKVDELGTYTPYLIWAEELPSFLGMDAYKSGKLADLTSLYDCADVWESGTKTQGDDKIPGPYICLLGGSTASGLFDVLPPASIGQGFTSRLMFIAADKYQPRIAEKPWTEAHQKLREALLRDIEVISRLKGGMRLDDIAKVLWTDFYLHRPAPTEEYNDDRLQGYAARKPFYAKKLALLLSIAESDNLEIQVHHLDKAFQLLEDVDRSVARVYSELASSVSMQHYPKVLRALKKAPNYSLSRSSLMQKFAYTMDRKAFDLCMEGLFGMGLVDSNSVLVSGKYKQTYKLVNLLEAERIFKL